MKGDQNFNYSKAISIESDDEFWGGGEDYAEGGNRKDWEILPADQVDMERVLGEGAQELLHGFLGRPSQNRIAHEVEKWIVKLSGQRILPLTIHFLGNRSQKRKESSLGGRRFARFGEKPSLYRKETTGSA